MPAPSRYRTPSPEPDPPELRLPPPVTGPVRHVLRAGERLDHLSSTYYGTPLEWWRIADANPEASPLAMIGADPVATTVVPLRPPAGPPPWERLRRSVAALDGVLDVRIVDDLGYRPERVAAPGGQVTVLVEIPVRALHVTHNRAEVTADAVADAVLALCPIDPVVAGTRVGQEIVVPPPAGTGSV